jgi:hypothetical protein
MASWSHRGFSVQHFRALVAETNVDLYAGHGARAYERVAATWPALERSFLLRVQLVRGDAQFLRARCALASIDAKRESAGARLREATRAAEILERERTVWTAPMAHLLRACIAMARGDRQGCVESLRQTAEEADAADMAMHAAVARFRLGELTDGAEGAALRARADEWAAAQGVRSPHRLAAMLAPFAPPPPGMPRA